jgi:hypothetical protein
MDNVSLSVDTYKIRYVKHNLYAFTILIAPEKCFQNEFSSFLRENYFSNKEMPVMHKKEKNICLKKIPIPRKTHILNYIANVCRLSAQPA